MKKFVACFLAGIMMTSMAACGSSTKDTPANRLEKIKSAGKIVLATSPDYAPYEFEDIRKSGQDAIVGADIELAKYIAKNIGVDLVIETMDFSSVVASVTEGKADMAISGLAPKPERKEAMELSSGYNKKSDGFQGFVIPADKLDQYKTLEDFKGKKLAIQNGSLQADLASAQIEGFIAESISSLNDGIMMLKAGKVDALVIPSTTGNEYCKNYPELSMSNVKLDYETEGTVVGVKKGEAELIAEINKWVEKAENEGLYAQWVIDNLALAAELNIK